MTGEPDSKPVYEPDRQPVYQALLASREAHAAQLPPERADALGPIPTEYWRLAELIAAEPSPAPQPDLFSRLQAQEGDRATGLWKAALDVIAHEDAMSEAQAALELAIDESASAALRALAELKRLREGDAWHVEYAEGQAGEDVEAWLVGGARALRAALALARKTV